MHLLLCGRKAVEAAPDKRVVAGLMGNLGALMMGAHGSLERALEYTENSIQAGLESSMKNSEIVAGKLQILPSINDRFLPNALL